MGTTDDKSPAIIAAVSSPMPPRLRSTQEAARALNVSTRTLHRWLDAGIVATPERTAGGHYRWDVEQLRRQVREYQQRRAEGPCDPPFAPGLADAPRHPEQPS